MKTRTGFVSNSSSSSFVVAEHNYPNVFALATEMIKARGWDDDKDMVQRLRASQNRGTDPDSPVSFPTTNYETYIVKQAGYYIVATSHNYDWDDVLVGIEYNMPQPIVDYLGDRWDCEMLCFDTITDFWYPKIGAFGKKHRVNTRYRKDGFGHSHYCTECLGDMMIEKCSGKVMCSECRKEES